MFHVTRALGAVLPIPVLWVVCWPFAAARATLDFARSQSKAKGRAGDAANPLARNKDRWREQVAIHTHRPLMYWADRLSGPRWGSRIEVGGLDELRHVLEARPVVAVTLHYGPLGLLASILRSRGIRAAIVVNDRLWPLSDSHRRKTELTRIGDTPTNLPAADPRALVEFLRPGVCLVIAPDFARGKTVEVAVEGGGRMRLASGAFRLARQANAAVVPVLIAEVGRWRFRVHVGTPIPEAALVAGDEAAAQAVVADLWPIIAADPRQARGKLITAVTAE